MARMFSEPHSTKQIEDGIGWGKEIAPERLVDTWQARELCQSPEFARRLTGIGCPVLVVHGDGDRIRPHSEGVALADRTGGSLVTVAGGGHSVQGRDPVMVNRLVKDFVDTVVPRPVRRPGCGR